MKRTEQILHAAVCQAVGVLNTAPELAMIAEGRQISDILRKALVDYADAVMDEYRKPGSHKGTVGVALPPGGQR
jgi:hypothetical protein